MSVTLPTLVYTAPSTPRSPMAGAGPVENLSAQEAGGGSSSDGRTVRASRAWLRASTPPLGCQHGQTMRHLSETLQLACAWMCTLRSGRSSSTRSSHVVVFALKPAQAGRRGHGCSKAGRVPLSRGHSAAD